MHGSRTAKTVESMSIKRAKGGFIASHHYDNSNSGPSYTPPSEHVFKSHKELQKHVKKHFGDGVD